jgi:type IV secretory pathway VirB3-like protein
MSDKDLTIDPFAGEPLAKARTLPDMLGAFPAKSLVLACLPVGLSVLLRGAWWPLLLLPVTFVLAYLACLSDLYIFEVFAAATMCKGSKTRRLWGVKRYVPR